MATTHKPMTADELLRLADDGQRHELVAGELRTMTPTRDEHGWLSLNLAGPLQAYARAHRLGRVYGAETGFRLAANPDTVRAPDAAFVRRERVIAEGPIDGYRAGAPDLAIEIISPNDLYTEVDEKVALWLAHGAQMVIVVNPRRRTVAVHRPAGEIRLLTEADTLDGAEVVPGWTLPVRDLFADDSDGQPAA